MQNNQNSYALQMGMQIIKHLEESLTVSHKVNIHLTNDLAILLLIQMFTAVLY